MFFTVPPRSSALIITKQQTAPSRSKATIANLSPELKPAFSLKSLGKTICPLASRVTTASILQHSLFSDMFNQTYQTNLNIYTFLKNLKKMKNITIRTMKANETTEKWFLQEAIPLQTREKPHFSSTNSASANSNASPDKVRLSENHGIETST
jgi:hypothetical protein